MAVGVKAANLAELYTLLPERVPVGFAVPFGYYQRFLDSAAVDAEGCAEAEEDCVDEDRSVELCAQAHALCVAAAPETVATLLARLLDDEAFRTNSPLREACLDGVRHLMRHADVDARPRRAVRRACRGDLRRAARSAALEHERRGPGRVQRRRPLRLLLRAPRRPG